MKKDLTLFYFLNGLPIVVIELKSPSREGTDASDGYRQLKNYMKEIPSMFIYNAICVMSDQLTSKQEQLLLVKIVLWSGKQKMVAMKIQNMLTLIHF